MNPGFNGDFPTLALGTAMWGWTVAPKTAFGLLDAFYSEGYRKVDTATNYPINKKPGDFRKAETLVNEWTRTHGIHDLEVIVKIGSINNLKTPDNNLSKSFVLMCLDEYAHLLGHNFNTLMIHWDNRNDLQAISGTFEALQQARDRNINPGISGIKYPDIYFTVNQYFKFDFSIQIKYNLFYSDLERYQMFKGRKRFWAYGINGGGLKLDEEEYHQNSSLVTRGGSTDSVQPIMEALKNWMQAEGQALGGSFHAWSLANAFYGTDMEGVVVGPSGLSQLQDIISTHKKLLITDLSPACLALKALVAKHGKV